VPEPISKTSRAVSGESIYGFEGWVWIDLVVDMEAYSYSSRSRMRVHSAV
jgi:hypothetical protein